MTKRMIEDTWIEVSYFDVPGESKGSTRMSLSELGEWLGDNPGYLICRIEEMEELL